MWSIHIAFGLIDQDWGPAAHFLDYWHRLINERGILRCCRVYFFNPLGYWSCNIYGVDYVLDLCAVLCLAWCEYVIPLSLLVLLSDGLRINLEHSIKRYGRAVFDVLNEIFILKSDWSHQSLLILAHLIVSLCLALCDVNLRCIRLPPQAHTLRCRCPHWTHSRLRRLIHH